MKIKIFLGVILIISQVVIGQNNKNSNNNNNDKLLYVIQKMVVPFLKKIPEDLLLNYGINTKEEISNASLGTPIKMYSIKNDSVYFFNMWRVPLIINNEYRALFTVVKDSILEFKIVDYGATRLADIISMANNEYKLKGILRVYRLHKDYFICDDNNDSTIFIETKNIKGKKNQLSEIIKEINTKL